ncbi:MAG: Uncharacterized protein G01um10147_65 [Microgenomates group bacterium Gr01-1014_7]|nr:MAG: Uncharacterized protein G01um10147_65 [Microgenomates group bacterium Gr01-1014_7]
MRKHFVLITLILITLLGGFLRFYKNTENPPSLNGDEISFAYTAYSILNTGRDEYGKFLPITFQAVGDYKNPIPGYIMAISIKLFGLNDFAVRFQNFFIGTLIIPSFFLFLFKIFKEKRLALVGSFFLAISSWHIFYSRMEYEYIIASFFVLLGIWFFMKMFDGGRKWTFLSAFFLILTMYTAPAPRLFVPVFIVTSLIFNFRKFKTHRNKIIIFVSTCVILGLPLVYATLFQGAGTRLTMVLISNDVEFQRYILLNSHSFFDFPMLIFFWIKRYLSYLDPNFLFINGLNMTVPGTFGLGVLYLFELPFLLLGIIEFIKRKIPYKSIFVIWLLTGIFPDSITNNQIHAGRLLHIAPIIILITALGAIRFCKWIVSLSKVYQRFIVAFGFSFVAVLVFIHAFLTFAVHFPRAKGESFDEGLKQAALYIRDHQESYNEIVFDPRRGIEGPYLVSNPYLYVLFYTKYDPKTYQTETKIHSKDSTYYFKFNKYTFRQIDWTVDQDKKGVLFIGSPWSFPKDLKEGEILEKIYLSNGYPAFYIVSPKW